MGSFAFTCAVSGLPIEVGDPLRYVLLVENPFDSNLVCYSTDMWYPRTWPLRAKYNDYGSIESYDEKSVSLAATMTCLNLDMVERGIGDNSCHDVATEKGMSFESTLEAVWEKRLQVARHVNTFDLLLSPEERDARAERMKKFSLEWQAKTEDPDYVDENEQLGTPTLRNVQRILSAAGFKVSTPGDRTATSLMVDEVERAWVRVRVEGYGENEELLEDILPALRVEYAAMITVGTGSYASRSEVQVMPKPMKREKPVFFRSRERQQGPLHVYQAMILDEVWDELVAGKVGIGWDEKVKAGFGEFRADAQKLWDEATRPLPTDHDGLSAEIRRLDRRLNMEEQRSPVGSWVAKSAVPGVVGLSEHWQVAADMAMKGKFKAKQVDEFLDDVAGFSLIQSTLPAVRHWWKPSFSCGPQFGEHRKHIETLRAFTRAGTNLHKRRKAKYA